ncbi:hypothetical protein ACFJGV_14940 [Cnuibacter sp. UC19_7]|uniref:hypothetical protein n=1 Tax=Cnuibacter sp. UC19_7 TaxID=3350166 RepID=UPI00366AEB52
MPDHRRHSAWSARHLLSRWQLLQLAAVVAAGAAVLVVTSSMVQSATVEGAREALAAAPGAAGGVTVTMADLPTSDAAATPDVAALLRDAMRPAEVDVVSSVRADGVAASMSGVSASVDLVADESLPASAELSSGAWPGPGETAIEEHAAAALGVMPGSVLLLGTEGRPFTVSGLWHASDPLAPRWAGHPAPTSGHDGDRLGPALLSADDLRAAATTRSAEWTVVPRPDSLTLAGIDRLAERADAQAIARDVAAAVSGLPVPPTASGGLAETAATAARTAEGVRALAAVPLLLLLLIVVFGVARLWALVAETLSPTDALLRSRGAGIGWFRRWNAGDALLAGGAGVVVGGGVAVAVLGGDVASLSPVGALGALIPAVALVAVSILVRGGSERPAPKALRLVGLLALALVAALGVVVLWTDSRGIDALGTIALPAFVLAVVLGGFAATAPGARGLRARASASASTGAFLATAGLAARARVYASTALVVALAFALSVVAATLAATGPGAASAAAASRIGAAARFAVTAGSIVTPGPPPLAATVPTILDGSGTGAAALATTASVGADTFSLLALPASDAQPLLGIGLAADPAPAGLPASSSRLAVTIDATDVQRPGRLTATAWIAGASGALAAIPLEGSLELATGGQATLTAALPGSITDVSILAIDVALEDSPTGDTVTTRIAGIRALTDEGATAAEIDPARLSASDGTLSATKRTLRTLVDALPGPLQVTLDQAGATRMGAAVGGRLGFALPTGRTLDAQVADIAPSVPGTRGSQTIALDLTALARASLAASDTVAQPNELWVATPSPEAVAARFAQTTDRAWTVSLGAAARSAATVAPATTVAIVSAAAGVLMAALTLWSTLALLRRRHGDRDTVLAALGLSPRSRAAAGRSEVGIVVVVSAVVGAVAGLVAALLTGPIATATALRAPLAADPLAVDPVVLVALVAALVAVLVTSVLLAGRGPASRARSLRVRPRAGGRRR